MLTKENLIDAVVAGFTNSEIAEHLGVTPSAVTQALEKYNVKEAAAERAELSRFSNIDSNLDKIEEIVTKRLLASVGMLQDPLKLARVLREVNGAKRRSLAEHKQPGSNTNIAILQLPDRARVECVRNEQNEVIEIDGRPLITMQAGQLLKKVRERQATRDTERLPPTNSKNRGDDDGLAGKSIAEML